MGGSSENYLRYQSLVFECYDVLITHERHVGLSVTPWTVGLKAPLSKDFSRPEYWSRLPFSALGDLHDPRMEPLYLASPEMASGFFTTCSLGEIISIMQ